MPTWPNWMKAPDYESGELEVRVLPWAPMGCSSAGRASGSDPEGREIKTRHPCHRITACSTPMNKIMAENRRNASDELDSAIHRIVTADQKLRLAVEGGRDHEDPTGIRVAVVDDDRDLLILVRRALETVGFDVVAVTDDEAITDAAVDWTIVDVALVDLVMPIPGEEVIEHIEAINPNVAIGVFTASVRERGSIDHIEHPVIKKGLGGDELRAVVLDLLRDR